MSSTANRTGTALALVAAASFGATAPLVKACGRDLGPFTTACLLYVGSLLAGIPRFGVRARPLGPRRIARVGLAAVLGASIAPALFAWGISRVSGAAGGLLLATETVATVVLARVVLREVLGSRSWLGAASVVAGTALLASGGGSVTLGGALAIVGATFAWALDNVVTRPVADVDPVAVIRWKSALGAGLSLVVAQLVPGERRATLVPVLGLVVAGAIGYGLSLRAYLAAQVRIGAARTGTVFAAAPLLAAASASVVALSLPSWRLVAAAIPIAAGVWLQASDRRHRHAAVTHTHPHRHDDGHHDHAHEAPVDGEHSHEHHHPELVHEHDADHDG